jgi:uroporphyrinogen-III synthase
MAAPRNEAPVLLLKTRSVPNDGYEDLLSQSIAPVKFLPTFIPVLEHRFRHDALQQIAHLIRSSGLSLRPENTHLQYGGVIFTSQRAVEAFSEVVASIQPSTDIDTLLPSTLPLYVVGPATERGLKALGLKCQILGAETGNGEALAKFMLDHYNTTNKSIGISTKAPLLFLVGEQRRDIIPKTLHAAEDRIDVEELVVYETGEMASFHEDLRIALRNNRETGCAYEWIVILNGSSYFHPLAARLCSRIWTCLTSRLSECTMTTRAAEREAIFILPQLVRPHETI